MKCVGDSQRYFSIYILAFLLSVFLSLSDSGTDRVLYTFTIM